MPNRLIEHLQKSVRKRIQEPRAAALEAAVRAETVATIRDIRQADEYTLEAAGEIAPLIGIGASRATADMNLSLPAAARAIIQGVIGGTTHIEGDETRVAEHTARALMHEAFRLEAPLPPNAVGVVTGAIEATKHHSSLEHEVPKAAIQGVIRASNQLGPAVGDQVQGALRQAPDLPHELIISAGNPRPDPSL